MSKVININGMVVKVIDNFEKQGTLSQEDKEMDIRAKEAVKAALEKANAGSPKGNPQQQADQIRKKSYNTQKSLALCKRRARLKSYSLAYKPLTAFLWLVLIRNIGFPYECLV